MWPAVGRKSLERVFENCALPQFKQGDKLGDCLYKSFFSMLPIVMRPVDKPSDLVTLIMSTGGKEVRITARLQCPIDLLEARKFRKAYTRLCISILELGHKTRVTCERTSLSCMVVIAALSYRLSLRKWDIWQPSSPRIPVWSGSVYNVGTVDADHRRNLE